MMLGRRGAASVALFAVLLAAAPVSAADPADDLLAQGSRLYTEEADYDGALQRFQESYRRRPSWKALSGMALVYQQQGRYVDAIDTYERLIAEFGPTLTDAKLTSVRKHLAELEQRVGVLLLNIAQPNTVVYVDGHEVGHGPGEVRVRVLPGPHTVVATLERHETMTRRVEAQPGLAHPVDVRLGAERVKVVVRRPRLGRPLPTWLPWATMGSGALLGLAGGGLHYWAQRDFDAFDAKVAREVQLGMPPGQVDESLKRSGEMKQVNAIALYAVGGAAVATGLLMLLANQLPPSEGSARVVFGGTSIGVAFDFDL
jgi:tetratricopeptide (TPR) repeat protein